MRARLYLIAAMSILPVVAIAGEIREFDLKTIERLGNELTRVSQTRDRGATDPARKRAVQTAKTALRGKLFDIHYDYVVLDDPDGSGFLVYALGTTRRPDRVVLGGHARVTVSADGITVKRMDRLSHTLMVEDPKHQGVPKETNLVGSIYNQIVSDKPVETLIYTSRLSGRPIFVQTPDGKMWQVANGRMFIDKSKPGGDSMGAAARKAFNENGR